ncbi:MAG TPA: hypothetical protein VH083_00450, partial [Myxococcales bacterium]|nr:hypothetical protein [Myxococcales bacterium]
MKRGFEENVPKVRPRVRLGRSLDEQLAEAQDLAASESSGPPIAPALETQPPEPMHEAMPEATDDEPQAVATPAPELHEPAVEFRPPPAEVRAAPVEVRAPIEVRAPPPVERPRFAEVPRAPETRIQDSRVQESRGPSRLAEARERAQAAAQPSVAPSKPRRSTAAAAAAEVTELARELTGELA